MDRKDLDVTLYLVTDSSYHTEESLLRTVEEACKGGVTLVQLREKNKGGREYLDKAFKVKEITDRYNVPLSLMIVWMWRWPVMRLVCMLELLIFRLLWQGS